MNTISSTIDELQNENKCLREKLLEVHWRSIRKNLILIGTPKEETKTQTDSSNLHIIHWRRYHIVKHYIEKLWRVHILEGPSRSGKIRQVAAIFERYYDREMTISCFRLNKTKSGDRYKKEQFSAGNRTYRQTLLPIFRCLKNGTSI